MPAPAAAPGTHVTRDPVPNTRSPRNRRQSNSLTRTSLSATHVRAAARSALLRAPLSRPAPRCQLGPAPGRPAQTPVSETVLWCLRKEIRIIIFLTGDETLFQEAEEMGASKYWGGHCPALGSGNSVNSTRGGPWGRGSFRPLPECGRGRKATPLGLPARLG